MKSRDHCKDGTPDGTATKGMSFLPQPSKEINEAKHCHEHHRQPWLLLATANSRPIPGTPTTRPGTAPLLVLLVERTWLFLRRKTPALRPTLHCQKHGIRHEGSGFANSG